IAMDGGEVFGVARLSQRKPLLVASKPEFQRSLDVALLIPPCAYHRLSCLGVGCAVLQQDAGLPECLKRTETFLRRGRGYASLLLGIHLRQRLAHDGVDVSVRQRCAVSLVDRPDVRQRLGSVVTSPQRPQSLQPEGV